jgi:hypothetical protein
MHKYYAILGLKYGASPSEIKKAYYRLSTEIHPDINSSPSAIEEFVRINEAYEILLKIRKPNYRVTLKKKKKVSKEWLEKEKKRAKFEAAKKLKMKRDAYLKSIKKETYSSDVWKIVRAYILTLVFFGVIIFGSYGARPDDETFPVERLYLFLKVIGLTVTVIYVFVLVNFRGYYKED